MVKFFRKSISLSDFWVTNNERISDFYLTSWQRGESVLPMLLVRLLLASVAMAIFIWSLVSGASGYWIIYLTNWGLLLVTAMTLSGLTVSLLAACHKLSDGSKVAWYISMYWLFYNICITVAIMITGLYWILLYNPEHWSDENPEMFWLDVATHGLNSCVAFAEVVLSRTPLQFLHIYQPLGLGLWYAAFSGIYYAAGGTDRPDLFLYSKHLRRVILVELTVPWETNIPRDHTFKLNKYFELTNELIRNKFIVSLYAVEVGARGNPFIYAVLDWRQPKQAGVIVVASAASLIILYTILWGITICRNKISTALIRTTSLSLPMTPPDQHSPMGIV